VLFVLLVLLVLFVLALSFSWLTDLAKLIEIGGYRALEGVQILIGTKNVVVNYGVRNDFIIATAFACHLLPVDCLYLVSLCHCLNLHLGFYRYI
jgi:hypothetical protein